MRSLLLLMFVFHFPLAADVYILSPPNSGTHMMHKACHLLQVETSGLRHPDFQSYEHWINFVKEHSNDVIICNIRDPRDNLISYYNEFAALGVLCGEHKATQLSHGTPDLYRKWFRMSKDEHFSTMILDTQDNPLRSTSRIRGALQVFSAIKNFPNVHVFYYEHLIGPKGGGNCQTMKSELTRLCKVINGDSTQIPYAINNLYGNTSTFRKGTIGNWREEFNKENQAAFKASWNDLLIAWGYESDAKW